MSFFARGPFGLRAITTPRGPFGSRWRKSCASPSIVSKPCHCVGRWPADTTATLTPWDRASTHSDSFTSDLDNVRFLGERSPTAWLLEAIGELGTLAIGTAGWRATLIGPATGSSAPHQRREAIQRLANGEAQADVARSAVWQRPALSRQAWSPREEARRMTEPKVPPGAPPVARPKLRSPVSAFFGKIAEIQPAG